MLATLVMTVIGPDRLGLVQLVAGRVAEHGGNWLESRMCRLGGQFAGILRVQVPEERRNELIAALRALDRDGLAITAHPESPELESAPTDERGALATVDIVGHDRPGILLNISGVFAGHRLNVEELSSECVPAPMGGGMLFQARATVLIPPNTKLWSVRADLEKIAADLMVDVKLEPRAS